MRSVNPSRLPRVVAAALVQAQGRRVLERMRPRRAAAAAAARSGSGHRLRRAKFCQRQLAFPAFFTVLDHDIRIDAAAHIPLRHQAQVTRRGQLHEVVEDGVGHFFVEGAFIAVRPHVLLEGFQFDVLFVGDVVNHDDRKIGLAGQRAEAGEFGDLEVDEVISFRIRVFENFYILKFPGT